MSLFTQRKIRTLTGLLCAMTFSMFVFSYTLREPSLYFFRSVLGLSGSTCSCRHCITHLDDEDDSWFMERFNQSFHPLLSRKSSMLSDDTYRWWQVCQAALLIAEQNQVFARGKLKVEDLESVNKNIYIQRGCCILLKKNL